MMALAQRRSARLICNPPWSCAETYFLILLSASVYCVIVASSKNHFPNAWRNPILNGFLIFGWLVGMRRSILMLGSTLALFLYHAKWSPGHFGSRSSPLLFKSSWSPLGPGNMAQWGQQAQQGDRRGWGGRDRGDRDQWTGGRSGGGGGGYGAHNPYEVQLPKFLTTVVTTDDKDWSSIMMVDKRDDRLVSPFQAWLVSEIMANSASSINVLTERDQVMPPNSGFHLSLFANYTLDGIKAVLAVSIDSTTGSICGGWDPPPARALAHPAFQPFSWPMLRETIGLPTQI